MKEVVAFLAPLVPPLLMFFSTGAFLHSRSHPEQLPARHPLNTFPMQVGDWQGSDVPIPAIILESLGKGEFMERDYRRTGTDRPVELFLAFFPTQRTGATVHSPQHCLPGAGWAVAEHALLPLRLATGETRPVNRYIVARGGDRQLVVYWYQSHGRVVASEYWGKFYLVVDSVRFNRSDGALVRVSTPIDPEEGIQGAQERAVAFAGQILPELSDYIPN